MSLLDKFRSVKETIAVSKDVLFGRVSNDITDTRLPVFPQWFFSARIGQPRDLNVTEVRSFAKSCWVQMVINTFKKQISSTDWDILPVDANDETDYDNDIEFIKDFLNDINSEHETVLDLCSMAVTDMGEIDASVWTKVFLAKDYEIKEMPIIDDLGNIKGVEPRVIPKPLGMRDLVQIRPADASTFLKQIDVYRRLQGYYQYSFKNPRKSPVRFEPEEVIYLMMNKRSYSIYGFSPVQSVQQVLELLIQSTRWNKDFYKNNAIPDGIIGLENANPDSMKQFKHSWDNQFKGKPHKLLYTNAKTNFTQLVKNGRDMEWLDGQKWYFHLVFGIFGVSPAEAGFYEDVNRSAQEGQERVTVKNAIKPYFKVLETAITNNIIAELLKTEKPYLKFVFKPKDHQKEEIEFKQNMEELKNGTLTINEYRRMNGRDEVEWGDEPMKSNPFGGGFGNESFPQENNSSEEDDDKKDSMFKKNFEVFLNDHEQITN